MSTEIQGFRLSRQQEHVWTVLEGGSSCFAQCVLRVQGDVQLNRLQDALQTILTRHDILRTQYLSLSGMRFPVQCVAEFPPSFSSCMEIKQI